MEILLQLSSDVQSMKNQQSKGKAKQTDYHSDDEGSIGLSRQPQSSRRFYEQEDKTPKASGSRTFRTSDQDDEIPKGAKIKQPDPYDGKRGIEAESFIMKMELYFGEWPTAFPEDRKIKTTLNNMKDTAGKWAKPLMQKLLADQEHPYLTSWIAFKEGFFVNFGDPLKRERAIQNITNLKQLGSVQTYAMEFRNIKEELDWDEKPLIDTFIAGLKDNIKAEIMRIKITNDQVDNYSPEKIIELAIRTGDMLRAGLEGH
ncbi:retrotransposon gag protein, partial [Rhizoctonia solani AG-3 Rhs1AP]